MARRYGARNYDPAIGKWMNIDNLAEKYFTASPYHYAGNNPILYFDIDGNEFTESAWVWVNKLITDINSRQQKNNEKIAEIKAQLEAGGLSSRKERKLNNQINRLEGNNVELQSVQKEINILADSSQVYDVVTDYRGTETDIAGNSTTINSTSMNFTNGNIEITVSNGTKLDLFAHELKHAYQFEMGQASFGEKMSKGFEFLLDRHDELEGYKRQKLFGSDAGVTNIESLSSSHRGLPLGPISIHNLSPVVSDLVRQGNNFQLQALANQRKQAFRVNNRTFIPKTK